MQAVAEEPADTAVMERSSLLARRQRVVTWIAIAAAVLSTGGLVASLFIKSPQQLIADAAPPEQTVLTAVVERRVLSSTLVTRGKVEASTTLEVTPTSTTAGAQVVTGVRIKAGDPVRAGQVLLTVAGRPLIALQGSIPAYRDLKPGDTGADVKQLQGALRKLDYRVGSDRSGTFGAGTKRAVRQLYADLGYDAPDTGGPGGRTDRQQLAEAETAVTQAENEVALMRSRIDAGAKAGPGELSLSEQLRQSRSALAKARTNQAELIAITGTMFPLAEMVFLPSFPARVSAFSAKVGDTVQAPLITLSAGALAVRAQLQPEQGELVESGMKAKLYAEALDKEVDGAITSVGEVTADSQTNQQGETETSAQYRPALIRPAKPLPAQWAGQDVRVTITSAQSDQKVLVVPLSAVSAGADSKSTVSVLGEGGKTRRVEVRPGISGEGYVAVEPVTGALAEGERVVIGQQS